jgi:hypothetical protein
MATETYTNEELLSKMEILRNERSEKENQLLDLMKEYEKRVNMNMSDIHKHIEKFATDKERMDYLNFYKTYKDPVIWDAARRVLIQNYS